MSNPIYLALDVPQLNDGIDLVNKVKGHVGGIKLGLEFFCAHGAHGVHMIGQLGLPVFLDLKLHDIPNTVAGAMQAIHVLEPAIVTVHAGGGRAMMEDAKAAAGENTRVVAVTMLTSMDERDLARTGIEGSAHDQVMRLVEAGVREGGVSAHRVVFAADAAHHAGDQPAAGDAVDGIGGEPIESDDDRSKLIKRLEQEMRIAAARLDFERAAALRDRIYQLQTAE